MHGVEDAAGRCDRGGGGVQVRDVAHRRDDGRDAHRASGVGRHVAGVLVVAAALVIGFLVLRADAPPAKSAEREASRAPAPPPPTAAAGGGREEATTGRETANAGEAAAMPTSVPKTRTGKLRALRRLGIEPRRDAEGRRQLDAAPVIEALRAAGVEEGIAVFPPPGTDPPKAGVVVPEDVALPEGYVRHHQSTDDGQPLEPILMFHPDYEFTDEQGQPIALPADRVVPPELVPPGIPVRMLEIPPPRR
jgi:hypothetical protein